MLNLKLVENEHYTLEDGGEGLFDARFLYQLLQERPAYACISHKKLPTFPEHLKFVQSNPYKAWYIITLQSLYVGACYITRAGEIGIAIAKGFQGHGYAKKAIKKLIARHPDAVLANINPANTKSIKLFNSLGFKLIQHTYKLERSNMGCKKGKKGKK
jgi:RimJ/RimL family protein N-acetyltransferase